MASSATITHGWTTAQANAGKDVDQPNFNNHTLSAITVEGTDVHINSSGFAHSSGTTAQGVISDLDAAIATVPNAALAAARTFAYLNFR